MNKEPVLLRILALFLLRIIEISPLNSPPEDLKTLLVDSRSQEVNQYEELTHSHAPKLPLLRRSSGRDQALRVRFSPYRNRTGKTLRWR